MLPFQYLDHLPRGEDRDIGAGYVMASTAAGVTLLYFLLSFGAILLVGTASLGDLQTVSLSNAAVGLLWVFGILSGALTLAAVVAPLLFFTGIVAWRLVPPSQRYCGAIGGLLAMGLAYVVAGALVVGLSAAAAVASGGPLLDSLVGGGGIIGVAFLASSWIALPASVLTGTLYERSLGD